MTKLTKKLTIGLDIDRTINKFPEFFIPFAKAMRAHGHKIIIITGLGYDGMKRYMAKFPKDFYDEVVTTRQYNKDERSLIGKVPNIVVIGVFKHRICKEKNVDILFDDEAVVFRRLGKTTVFHVK